MCGLLGLLIYGIVLVTYSCDASDMFLSSKNELLSCDDVKAGKIPHFQDKIVRTRGLTPIIKLKTKTFPEASFTICVQN